VGGGVCGVLGGAVVGSVAWVGRGDGNWHRIFHRAVTVLGRFYPDLYAWGFFGLELSRWNCPVVSIDLDVERYSATSQRYGRS
jgi:hypothetical protein